MRNSYRDLLVYVVIVLAGTSNGIGALIGFEESFDGNGIETSSDLVRAFQDAGYEQGLRPVLVPEPKSPIPWLLFAACVAKLNRRPDC